MKASVIVPVYNMARFVGETLDSVLRQTCQDFEIIVVDDGSTDNTVAVVKDYLGDKRITLIERIINGGVTPAINDGLRVAKGDYVCPLGADDLLEPWMIEKQSAYLDEHPEIAAVFGMPLSMLEDGTEIECDDKFRCPSNRSRTEWYATLLQGNTLMGQTMLFRRSLVKTLGYWDEKLSAGNDIDWFVRIVKEHDIHVQHIPMARVRMRNDPKQLSADSAANRRSFEAQMDYVREKHIPKVMPTLKCEGMVLIATPFIDSRCQKNYVKSIIITANVLTKMGVEWDWMDFDALDDINRAKNAICARFLENKKYSDLIFIDADKSWNAMGIARMLTHEEEIVAGAYPNSEWSVRIKLDKECGRPVGKLKNGEPLLEAEIVSSGFIRFKRSALQRFRDGRPDLLYLDKRSGMSFDYRCTAFFDPARDQTGDDVFCQRWTEEFGQLWVEPQIDFEVAENTLKKGNLDKHFRDMKERERLSSPLTEAVSQLQSIFQGATP